MLLVQEREQHGEDKELVHAVIETQPPRGHSAVVFLDPHVGPREECGREGHESRERHQEHVEGIDEELLVELGSGTVPHHLQGQDRGREGREPAAEDVDGWGAPAVADYNQEHRPGERNTQYQG